MPSPRSTTELLAEASAAIKDMAEHHKGKFDSLNSRLQDLEQHVAEYTPSGSYTGSLSRAQVASIAVSALTAEASFDHLKAGNLGTSKVPVEASLKAALTTDLGGSSESVNTMPSNPERGGIITPVARPLSLLDVLPSRTVASDAVAYVQLTATGDAEEQVRQGDEKAEIGLDGNLVMANIVTIAGHTTASAQVLSDNKELEQKIDQVLRYKVRSRLEDQLINGPGGEGKIKGLLEHAVAYVPETPLDNDVDQIGAALASMRSNGYAPTVVVLNPMDWFSFTHMKDQEGQYLFGSPTAPVAPAIWNASVVQTSSLARGQALILDTTFLTVLDRDALKVMLSNSHKDYFTRNLVAILAELRAGLEVLDIAAIYLVPFIEPDPNSGD